MRFSFIFLLIISIITTLSARQVPEDTSKIYLHDPIIITATRSEALRSTVSPSVSILSTVELQNGHEKSILSLVSQRIPGVFVPERGILGFGIGTSAGQVSIRGIGGTPSTGVLLMIDGRPQFMGIFGHPLPDSYITSSAERVEVVRGPSSILYGTNAMGGVINVITRSSLQNGFTGNAEASYGTYNSERYNSTTSFKLNDVFAVASVGREVTDGHRKNSRFEINSGYIKGGTEITDNFTLTVDASISKFIAYEPGTASAPKLNGWADILRGYTGIAIDNKFSESVGSIRILHNLGKHKISDGFESNDNNSSFTFYQTLHLFENNTFTVGADYKQYGGEAKNVQANFNFGNFSAEETGVYAHLQHSFFNILTISGGLRYEYSPKFGDVLIPQIGAAYRFTDQTIIRTTVSKGFRSPTIRELYLFRDASPNLKPEYLWNYEAGIQHSFGALLSADLTAFITEGNNLIRNQQTSLTPKLTNSGSFTHRGVEISASSSPVENVTLNTNYSYLDPANETRSVPQHKFFAEMLIAYNFIEASASVQHVSKIYGDDFSRQRLPDYTLVGLKLNIQILTSLSLFISGENLLNQSYQTIYDYPMPGRMMNIGVKAKY